MIICGDCLKEMKKLQGESFDLIITSPPYNLRNSTGGGAKYAPKEKGAWKNGPLSTGYENYSDNMPHEEYVSWQRECLSEMMRLINDRGAIFYNHKWRVQNGLLQDRADIVNGFPVRQIIIWKKSGSLNWNSTYFLPNYEVIYLIAKKGFKLKKEAVNWGSVWEINPEKKTPHPAPFPEALTDKIISATEAQNVLDPFMGSGTTAISALKFGRKYLGIDNEPKYCKIAEERIKKWTQEKCIN